MVLIISKEDYEVTTEEVIDWLSFYEVNWFRINGEDLERATELEFSLGNSNTTNNNRIGNIDLNDVSILWFRRGGKFNSYQSLNKLDQSLYAKLKTHLIREIRVLRNGLAEMFAGIPALGNPNKIFVNKLECLRRAQENGLNIPDTIVTNNLKSLQEFASKHKRIITKSLYESTSFEVNDNSYILHTQEINFQYDIPDYFLPSLIQNYVDKMFELRIFYLDGDFYSMAIFSQNDEQTKVDFRNYNIDKPNRMVPFNLPASIKTNLDDFMRAMSLKSGSIDMIRSTDGQYIFLEVNPSGQFNMISHSCNLNLEKKMAEYLMKNVTNE